MRWFLNHYPDQVSRLHKFVHASDFITGRLCGEYGITDYTNALKSGYNLHRDEWPSYIIDAIGVRKQWLQQVRPSGMPLETIKAQLAAEWGLPAQIIVTTGLTDGCASQVASGAVSPGDWNTTIGTTLVIKGVTKQEIKDPSGAIYNHRHPAGYWMPGGASNTGADWVSQLFKGEDLQELSRLAAEHLPARHLAWPLIQQGERFPFLAPQAVGFWPEADKVETFTACMEGVAFIERYAYEKIEMLAGENVKHVFSAGGGSNSDTWLRIRSSIMNRPVCKMKNVSGAAGAAIVAASGSFYASLQEAANAMVSRQITVQPQPELVSSYNQKYKQFIQELKSRRILD
jgi:sugar (pentulose or hexulose) kinase